MKTIFDAVNLNNLHLNNRVIRSATWEALAETDGGPSEEQISVYDELAKGGVGGIITGFTSVDDHDFYIDGMARMSNDSLIDRWHPVVEVAHAQGTPIMMQLAMGEFVRKSRALEPDELLPEQVREVINLFGDAAGRAKAAGFDGVQIHAAHGFYLSRFISPAYNHRPDEYGGSTEARAKLLTDILSDMRAKALGIHITMKINCSDFISGGLIPDDALATILILEKAGLDSVEISGNGTSMSGIKAGRNEAYYLPFAKKMKRVGNIPVILVGGHRSIENMNLIVNEEGIDLLSVSRPLIREPNLVKRWESADTAPAKCVSCNMCYQTPGHKCIFNIRKSREEKLCALNENN